MELLRRIKNLLAAMRPKNNIPALFFTRSFTAQDMFTSIFTGKNLYPILGAILAVVQNLPTVNQVMSTFLLSLVGAIAGLIVKVLLMMIQKKHFPSNSMPDKATNEKPKQ